MTAALGPSPSPQANIPPGHQTAGQPLRGPLGYRQASCASLRNYPLLAHPRSDSCPFVPRRAPSSSTPPPPTPHHLPSTASLLVLLCFWPGGCTLRDWAPARERCSETGSTQQLCAAQIGFTGLETTPCQRLLEYGDSKVMMATAPRCTALHCTPRLGSHAQSRPRLVWAGCSV